MKSFVPGSTHVSSTRRLCVFSVVGTSRCDVRAACSGATPSTANVDRRFVPPATTRAGTAQRAVPTFALNRYPRFSEVMSAGVVRKPFQRFLRAGCKPLIRFAGSPVANTRLKPGANERETLAVAHPEAMGKAQRRTNSGLFRVSASLRLCVEKE